MIINRVHTITLLLLVCTVDTTRDAASFAGVSDGTSGLRSNGVSGQFLDSARLSELDDAEITSVRFGFHHIAHKYYGKKRWQSDWGRDDRPWLYLKHLPLDCVAISQNVRRGSMIGKDDSLTFRESKDKHVYLATLYNGEIDAVWKESRVDKSGNRELRQMFKEIEVLVKLAGRPGIPKIYGACVTSDELPRVIEIMEFLPMGALPDALRSAKLTHCPCCTMAGMLHSMAQACAALRDTPLGDVLMRDFNQYQFVFSADYQAHFVDLDDIGIYTPPGTMKYKGKPCAKKMDCGRGPWHAPEARCGIHEDGVCSGRDVSENLYLFGEMLLHMRHALGKGIRSRDRQQCSELEKSTSNLISGLRRGLEERITFEEMLSVTKGIYEAELLNC